MIDDQSFKRVSERQIRGDSETGQMEGPLLPPSPRKADVDQEAGPETFRSPNRHETPGQQTAD
jgi:hypothetical protein